MRSSSRRSKKTVLVLPVDNSIGAPWNGDEFLDLIKQETPSRSSIQFSHDWHFMGFRLFRLEVGSKWRDLSVVVGRRCMDPVSISPPSPLGPSSGRPHI